MWIQEWTWFPSNFGLRECFSMELGSYWWELSFRQDISSFFFFFWENSHKACSRQRCTAALLIYSCHWYTPKQKEKQKLNTSCRTWLLHSLTASYSTTCTANAFQLSTFALYSSCKTRSVLQWPPWVFPACLSPHSHSFNTLYFDVRKNVKVRGAGLHHCFIYLHSFHIRSFVLFLSSFPICFPSPYSADIRDEVSLRNRVSSSEVLRLTYFQFFRNSCTDINDGALVCLRAVSGHKPQYFPLLLLIFQRFNN